LREWIAAGMEEEEEEEEEEMAVQELRHAMLSTWNRLRETRREENKTA
jgi:hypothetical protein